MTVIECGTSQENETNLQLSLLPMGVTGLILFHSGLAFLEAGRSRQKNTATALTKNVTCLLTSIIVFWLCGYGVAFGNQGFLLGSLHDVSEEKYATFIMLSLMSAIPSSVLSGAVAERIHFTGHLLVSVFLSGGIFPFAVKWYSPYRQESSHLELLNWVHNLGVVDIGLTSATHVLSGAASLLACLFIGRRMEKFGDNFRHNIGGHSLAISNIGVIFIILGMLAKTCWLTSLAGISIIQVLVNCIIAGAAAGISSSIIHKISVCRQNDYEIRNSAQNKSLMLQSRKWSFYMVSEGCIAGLVGISSGAGLYPTWVACVIGVVSGVLHFIAIQIIGAVRLDDATDAIATHLVPGLWGSVALPVFVNQLNCALITQQSTSPDEGTTEDKWIAWGIQIGYTALGSLASVVWPVITLFLLFVFLILIKKLRVHIRVETLGSDAFKMNEEAYPDFDCAHKTDSTTFAHFESPGDPFLSNDRLRQKASGRINARSTSCTAVSYLGPSMTSTQKLPLLELQELSKSIPKIIVEEFGKRGEAGVSQPNPPKYKTVNQNSNSSIQDETANSQTQLIRAPPPPAPSPPMPPPVPPPSPGNNRLSPSPLSKKGLKTEVTPPAPPSSPDSATVTPVGASMRLDVKELRDTLKEQKRRLRCTGLQVNPDLNNSAASINSASSHGSVNSHMLKEVASSGFNYLNPEGISKILRQRSPEGTEDPASPLENPVLHISEDTSLSKKSDVTEADNNKPPPNRAKQLESVSSATSANSKSNTAVDTAVTAIEDAAITAVEDAPVTAVEYAAVTAVEDAAVTAIEDAAVTEEDNVEYPTCDLSVNFSEEANTDDGDTTTAGDGGEEGDMSSYQLNTSDEYGDPNNNRMEPFSEKDLKGRDANNMSWAVVSKEVGPF